MTRILKFEVFGPASTLQRMGSALQEKTPHIHYFTREVSDQQRIWVFLYEDQLTSVQSSRCVTCIVSEEDSAVYMEIADIGKQDGFRGSQERDDQPVYEQIMDFILDFSKQFGLTVQKKEEE